ncbi:PAS domain-containing protein [Corallococcus sp. AS-1-12]|uniref:PAS domain-containing protein n=1 Tax=Corallococcus sp. AS-1-12 TaxID=2874598 RepID=UPI001CBFFCF8|nr:PAS domain-containing protein [Corallococcus sp. AS-1-12]
MRTRGLAWLVLLTVLSACGGGEGECGPSTGVVTKVIDGDTVVLQDGERIRYLLADTPETTRGHDDCFGEEAAAFNRSLVEGRTVRLRDAEACTDRFGRRLAYVSVDGEDVNALLVRRGYACTLFIPPAGASRRGEFEALELEARRARRGLWGRCPAPCPRGRRPPASTLRQRVHHRPGQPRVPRPGPGGTRDRPSPVRTWTRVHVLEGSPLVTRACSPCPPVLRSASGMARGLPCARESVSPRSMMRPGGSRRPPMAARHVPGFNPRGGQATPPHPASPIHFATRDVHLPSTPATSREQGYGDTHSSHSRRPASSDRCLRSAGMNPFASTTDSLADLVEARREDILRRWGARLDPHPPDMAAQLQDRLAGMLKLLDALVLVLRQGAVENWSSGAVWAHAREIGQRRFQAGARVETLVEEYGLLREAILEVLDASHRPLGTNELRALWRALDRSLTEAVAHYVHEHGQALRSREQRLQEILDHAQAAIYAKDASGRYLFINRPFEAISGHPRESVLGRSDLDLFPRETAERFRYNDRRVLASKTPLVFDEEVLQPDGTHLYHTMKFPLPSVVQGEPWALCGVSTDITATRTLRQERDEAREQLHRVLTQLPVVLWAFDAQGVFTLFEGEGVTSTSVPSRVMHGRSVFDVFRNRRDVLEVVLRALAGERLSTELYLMGVWFEVRLLPVFDAGGRVVSVSGVSLDITERRRAEQELRASETRYRLATLATRDIIWDWDLVTDEIHWSESAPRVLRLDTSQGPPVMDTAWWTASLHPDEREQVMRELQRAIDSHEGHWEAEYRIRRGDGTWAFVEDRGRVVKDLQGRPVRMVGAMQDVTDRHEAEAEARRRAEFEQLLIGIVGHDLRNPISAITMAATSLARREDPDPRDQKAVARILSSAERAHRMLRDVLDFTQARLGGGIPMAPRDVDLLDLVRQVLDEVQQAHPERRLEVAGRGVTRLWCDPDRLAQVITNLVNNALAYGDAHCPVRVRLRGQAGGVTLAVKNQGRPIPQHQLPHLFEPLKRAELRDGQRNAHGLGLGLFIVKHIVDAHGGRLRVRSTAQDGTTFLVQLPRRPPARD